MWVRFPPPALVFELLSTFSLRRFGQNLDKIRPRLCEEPGVFLFRGKRLSDPTGLCARDAANQIIKAGFVLVIILRWSRTCLPYQFLGG